MGASAFEVCCGHFGRFLVFFFIAAGVCVSAFSTLSCEFFSYKSSDPSILPPPYTNQTEGFVGLFQSYEGGASNGKCLTYEYNFIELIDQGYNAFFITSQFAALVAPSCATLAFFINILEWTCCSHACSYLAAFSLLFISFVAQGFTFMVYGQNEFCFDDNASLDCQIELGAILSISAASCFYVASVVWCCMPRIDPAYKKNKNNIKQKEAEDDPYYVAPPPPPPSTTRQLSDDDDPTNPSQQQEQESMQEDEPAAMGAGSWADVENKQGGAYADPQQQQQQQTNPSEPPPPAAESRWQVSQQQQQQQQQQPPPPPQQSSGTSWQDPNQQQQQPAAYSNYSMNSQQQQQQQQWHGEQQDAQNIFYGGQPQPTEPGADPFANPFVENAPVQNFDRP